LLKYSDGKEQIDSIISEWSIEEETSKVRRDLRHLYKDVKQLRASGAIAQSDTYVPQRIIDQYIRQDKPAQLAFVEKPDRLLIFKDLSDPLLPTEDLERAFTDFMRFPGWLTVWHRAFDGCDLHGGVCLEVRFDESRPLHCDIEYVRREDYLFPVEANDIQSCEYILRRYKYMPFQLEDMVKKYGFNAAAIQELTKDKKSARHTPVDIYKVFFKKEGIVHIAWYNCNAKDWLKQPVPLELGIYSIEEIINYNQQVQNNAAIGIPVPIPTPAPVVQYPVFFLPYEVIEDDKLLSSKGRAFRDAPDQEAATELWTGIINTANKASKVYGSRANSNMDSTGSIDTTTPIKPDTIMGKETKFWNFPMPDASLLAVAQQFASNKAAQAGNVEFAANNRNDSKKTATEIQAARQEGNKLSSLSISAQSITILAVYELCWEIGRSQILIGGIDTFPIDKERLVHNYRLGSAGDVDLLAREDKKQVIRETFPLLVGTPVGNLLLKYMIDQFFPEKSREWNSVLEAQDPLQLVQMALGIFQAMPMDSLDPVQQAQLQEIIQLFQQYVTTRTGTQGTGAPGMEEPALNSINGQNASNQGRPLS